MTKKHIYVGALFLIVISMIYPPIYEVRRNGVISEYGWTLITDMGRFQSINAPVLVAEFAAIGVIVFLLIKITSESQ